MSGFTYQLLDEPLLPYTGRSGERNLVSLPALLVALAKDDVVAFEEMRPHQHAAWMSFLTQLALLAAGDEAVSALGWDEAGWRRSLVELSEGKESAWALIVDDWTKPAFMQFPISAMKERADYKSSEHNPATLDLLVTSSNFDVKHGPMNSASVAQWIYALVNLQTTEGSLGSGNYGVARMNRGYGSRPRVGFTPSLAPGLRFARDIEVIQHSVSDLRAQANPRDAVRLTWLAPWNGKSSYTIDRLHVLYLECCRRIRLQISESTKREIVARRATSKVPRVNAEASRGNVGDPWIPIRNTDTAALNVQSSGFHFKLASALLVGVEYQRPICGHMRVGDRFLELEVTARRQGGTQGYHRRVIQVPPKRLSLFEASLDNDVVKARSRLLHLVADYSESVVGPALYKLLIDEGDKISNRERGRIAAHVRHFDNRVDEIFFPLLWKLLDDIDDESLDELGETAAVHKQLAEIARDVFERGVAALLTPGLRTRRREHAARQFLSNAIRKRQPQSDPPKEKSA